MTLTKFCVQTLSLTAGSLLLAAAAGAAPTGTASTDAGPPAKLKKQISVMEKILDETLVDSKNLLVANHHVSRGVYLPEFGVLFTLDASILSPDNEGWWKNFDFSKFRVETKDGTTVLHLNDNDADNDSDTDIADKDAQQADKDAQKAVKDAQKAANDANKKLEKRELTRKEILKARQERYENGKAELVTALLDYGETLNGLRDDQWVGVAAYFDDDMFGEPSADTVVLKAKMADLRAHGAGRISDQEAQNRVVIEEY
jgi:hypothetical protein